jgi:hypothetical protein
VRPTIIPGQNCASSLCSFDGLENAIKEAAVKKAARKVKQSGAPVVETVAVEVIEQPAPDVVTVTEVEETPGSGLRRALKSMNPNR